MSNLINVLNSFFFNPYIWIIISVICLLVSKFVFKIDYANCFEIIEKHIDNFRHRDTKKILIVPFFIHFFLPALVALGIVNITIINAEIINNVTVILSILTSMFFTLLVLAIDMKSKIEIRDKSQGIKVLVLKKLIVETYYSIMFEILISITLLILSFIHMFTKKYGYISSFIIYYLLFLLIVNLFIVLKRIFIIVNDDLNQDP
ncbi:hypothetical protein AAK964_10310 [Tissierella praeacuta]|uniref:hypothetical protein n=1 Tax=Tissierella praeacuta TaxID=43131 RepID=UPI003517E1F1